MIKIKEKGWFKGLGLHHGVFASFFVIALGFLGLQYYGAVAASAWFASREEKEYELRRKGLSGVEWLDWITPLVMSFATAWIIERI